jgi:anti-anti-sigma factor
MRYHVEHASDQCVIHFMGYLDFESFIPLKEDLLRLLNNPQKPIVFDFTELEFVGSSGITPFLRTLQELGQDLSETPVYQNVSTEFKRMLETSPGPAPVYTEQNCAGGVGLTPSS